MRRRDGSTSGRGGVGTRLLSGRTAPRSLPTTSGAWIDVVRIATGAAAFAVTWREAAGPELPAWEEPTFRAVNELPESGRLIWPVMQFGSFAAIPVVTVAIARMTGDRRFAASVGVAGLAAYLGAKVVKRRVGRGRPHDVYDEITRRENASGYGYPSGHAAEAAAMATVIASRLPLIWQWVPVALVASVSTGRLYFGAHLPHDVLGGAAMGTLIGGSVNVAHRAIPHRSPSGAPSGRAEAMA